LSPPWPALEGHAAHLLCLPVRTTVPTCGVTCVDQIEHTIELEGPESVAAVIVEPISNTGGIHHPATRVPAPAPPDLRSPQCAAHLRRGDHRLRTHRQMFAAQTFACCPMCSAWARDWVAATVRWPDRRSATRSLPRLGEDAANLEFSHGNTFAAQSPIQRRGVACISGDVSAISAPTHAQSASTCAVVSLSLPAQRGLRCAWQGAVDRYRPGEGCRQAQPIRA